MSRPVTVSEAQDQVLSGSPQTTNPHRWLRNPKTRRKRRAFGFHRQLETAFDLYRMIHRLHRLHEGLKAQHETVRKHYEAEDPPRDEPPTIEVAVAEEIDVAVDELQNVGDQLLKASRTTDASVREEQRRDRKEGTP